MNIQTMTHKELYRAIPEHLGWFVAESTPELLGMTGETTCLVMCRPDGSPTNHFEIAEWYMKGNSYEDIDLEEELWECFEIPYYPNNTNACMEICKDICLKHSWDLHIGWVDEKTVIVTFLVGDQPILRAWSAIRSEDEDPLPDALSRLILILLVRESDKVNKNI